MDGLKNMFFVLFIISCLLFFIFFLREPRRLYAAAIAPALPYQNTSIY